MKLPKRQREMLVFVAANGGSANRDELERAIYGHLRGQQQQSATSNTAGRLEDAGLVEVHTITYSHWMIELTDAGRSALAEIAEPSR